MQYGINIVSIYPNCSHNSKLSCICFSVSPVISSSPNPVYISRNLLKWYLRGCTS